MRFSLQARCQRRWIPHELKIIKTKFENKTKNEIDQKSISSITYSYKINSRRNLFLLNNGEHSITAKKKTSKRIATLENNRDPSIKLKFICINYYSKL